MYTNGKWTNLDNPASKKNVLNPMTATSCIQYHAISIWSLCLRKSWNNTCKSVWLYVKKWRCYSPPKNFIFLSHFSLSPFTDVTCIVLSYQLSSFCTVSQYVCHAENNIRQTSIIQRNKYKEATASHHPPPFMHRFHLEKRPNILHFFW